MLWIDCEKNTIFFLRMIGSKDRFNVCSATKYYNVVHIKDNIYEVDGKGNYFRLVSLKTVHPNEIELFPMILQKLWISSTFSLAIIDM